jgi:hypothetical protein
MAVSMPTLTLPTRPARAVPRSQAERLWLIGGALVAFLLLVLGYFLFISPQRSHTSRVNSQVDTARQQNATLQAHIDALRLQNRNLAKYEQQLKTARLALPSTSGVSDFLRSLQALGNATSTDVTALTVGSPTNVSTVAGAAPAARPTATTASGGTTAGGTIFALPITAQVSGAPAALNKFLQQLQAVQPRAVLITQLTETTGTAPGAAAVHGSSGTALQLTMQAFVAPSNPTEKASLAAGSH